MFISLCVPVGVQLNLCLFLSVHLCIWISIICLIPDGSSTLCESTKRGRHYVPGDKTNVFYFSWGQEVTLHCRSKLLELSFQKSVISYPNFNLFINACCQASMGHTFIWIYYIARYTYISYLSN